MDKDRLAKLGLGAVASYGELPVSLAVLQAVFMPICITDVLLCFQQSKGRPFVFCRFCF